MNPGSPQDPEAGAGSAAAPPDVPVEGVRALDHTADVGIEIRAPELGELIRRAILGMDWLLREGVPPRVGEGRTLSVEALAPSALLRAALREALLWHDLDGFAPATIEVTDASPGRFEARVRGGIPESPPVREIKGVTLHGLAAEPRGDLWWGRVIFDV